MADRDWDWQPSFCRQTEAPPGLVMQCTTCLPTCATCVKPVPCDFSSAMPGVLGRRGFLVTVPVAFRRSTRLIYTWLYAAGPKWQKQDVRLDHSLHTVCWQGDGCVEPWSRELWVTCLRLDSASASYSCLCICSCICLFVFVFVSMCLYLYLCICSWWCCVSHVSASTMARLRPPRESSDLPF